MFGIGVWALQMLLLVLVLGIGMTVCVVVVRSLLGGFLAAGKVGRYQISHSPNVPASTFLLDTQTGAVWQAAAAPEGATIWQQVRQA